MNTKIKELLKKIRKIELSVKGAVNDIFAGEYKSAFKGRGVEFLEVREYVPGDDIRFIDWNVTARLNKPFIKIFHEERELTAVIVVDISSSGIFGTNKKLKIDTAAEIAALLAFSAIANEDKVGLLLFTDKIEKFIPPKKGKKHVLRVIREILGFNPKGKETNISMALEFLNKILKRRSIIFLISDFYSQDFEKPLKILKRKHDIVAIDIKDIREESFVNAGLVALQDAETKEIKLIDLNSSATKRNFLSSKKNIAMGKTKILNRSKIDNLSILSDENYVNKLMVFFKKRGGK